MSGCAHNPLVTDTAAPTKLNVVRSYKIGRNDDEGIAATENDLIECRCCGRKIRNVTVLSNGLLVGSECEVYLTRPDLRSDDKKAAFFFGRRNKHADAILAAGNYA